MSDRFKRAWYGWESPRSWMKNNSWWPLTVTSSCIVRMRDLSNTSSKLEENTRMSQITELSVVFIFSHLSGHGTYTRRNLLRISHRSKNGQHTGYERLTPRQTIVPNQSLTITSNLQNRTSPWSYSTNPRGGRHKAGCISLGYKCFHGRFNSSSIVG